MFVPRLVAGREHVDRQAWMVMDTSAGPVELADPLQVLFDVASTDAPDAAEAAAVLRQAVVSEPLTRKLRDWLLAVSSAAALAGQVGSV